MERKPLLILGLGNLLLGDEGRGGPVEDMGVELSPPVRAAVDTVVREARSIALRHARAPAEASTPVGVSRA